MEKIERKKTCHTNSNQKKPAVSDKVDFNAVKIPRVKEGHSLDVNASAYRGDIEILNIYAPNNMASKYIIPKLRSK